MLSTKFVLSRAWMPVHLNTAIKVAYEKGYRVTDSGQLMNPKGEIVGGYLRKTGYWTASVRVERERVTYEIHRLAAYQKYGNAIFQEGVQVRHLNGNSTDNSLSNLALGTQSENMMDKPSEVRKRAAKTAALAQRSLTQAEVSQLREDRANGMKYFQLMAKYGLAKSTVSYIVNRKTYE